MYILFVLLTTIEAISTSPSSIQELVGWVYPDGGPDFLKVPSPAHIAIANNETALMKISALEINPYPLVPGYVDFTYLHNLLGDIPAGSTMDIHAFVDGKEYQSTVINICDYLPFAKITCPYSAYTGGPNRNTTTLQVPDNGYDNRFSFIAKVETPDQELILHLAVIIDCINIKDEL